MTLEKNQPPLTIPHLCRSCNQKDAVKCGYCDYCFTDRTVTQPSEWVDTSQAALISVVILITIILGFGVIFSLTGAFNWR